MRKNAFSMKYGFSKGILEKACNGVNIKYVHISELGIESSKRQTLVSQNGQRRLGTGLHLYRDRYKFP